MSILESAQKSLNKIEACELKTTETPPEKVQHVAEAILILFEKPSGWKSFQKFTSDPLRFLDTLKDLDAMTVSSMTMNKLDESIAQNNLQDIEAVKAVSQAASHLANWVVSN